MKLLQRVALTQSTLFASIFTQIPVSVIIIPSIISIIIGIFFVTAISPITSLLVQKYETVKGGYERDKDYLAAITVNGIWIKEKDQEKNNLIRASNLDGENLINLTIYEFDKQNDFIRTIHAKSANISSSKWILNGITISDKEGNSIKKKKSIR